MKSEHTKSIVQRWFVPVLLLLLVSLTYGDIISSFSSKINLREIEEANKINNYDFNVDIQGPIERANSTADLSSKCTDIIALTLNHSKDLTLLLERENDIHDKKWRIQIEARWRRTMLELLENATVASIKVGWKTDELCRLEEYISFQTSQDSAIAKFQSLVRERGLAEAHLRKFQSELRTELEKSVNKFNELNTQRLEHLASYDFDVTYERSLTTYLKKGPAGGFFRELSNNISSTLSPIITFLDELIGTAKSFVTSSIAGIQDIVTEIKTESDVETEVEAQSPAQPVEVKIPAESGQQNQSEVQVQPQIPAQSQMAKQPNNQDNYQRQQASQNTSLGQQPAQQSQLPQAPQQPTNSQVQQQSGQDQQRYPETNAVQGFFPGEQ